MIVAERGAPSIPAPANFAAAPARHAMIVAAGLATVAAIAVADAFTGYEIRLAILYLAPIAFATWFWAARQAS